MRGPTARIKAATGVGGDQKRRDVHSHTMEGSRAFWVLLITLPFASLALAAPTSEIAKRSLSSLARTSQMPQGQARQHGGDKRGMYGAGVFGYGPLLQDLEARRVREAALREALIRRLNRGEANMYEDDNGVVDKRNVAALARAGELRGSAATANAKRNVAALLRQSKYGSPSSAEAAGSHPEEDEDEAAFAGNPDDADRPEKRISYVDWGDRHLPDLVDEAAWTDYDEEGVGAAPVKRFLGRIPNMGRHRPKQTSGGSGIKTSRRRPHSS